MSGKDGAFVKGGFGCLLAFAVVAIVCVAIGWNVQIDAGGACMLFGIGGVIGLVVLAVYKKGQRDGRGPREDA